MLLKSNSPSVALIHEWLVVYSGAEKVLEQMIRLYPSCDLYAVVDFLQDDLRHIVGNKPIETTFIQKLPFAKKRYRSYLPLMPFAIEQLDVTGHDIVISSNHAVSKGILTQADQLHLCYCHSPIRYAWDLYFQYLKEANLEKGLKAIFAKLILHYVRGWDFAAAQRVDGFIANSHYIKRRIYNVYGREADVIYPPVSIDDFTLCTKKENYYVAASRLVPYKRMDLIVRAFSKMPDLRLIVIGDGPDMDKIKKEASPNIEILGFQSFQSLRTHLQAAKALVFAAEEDFGILPVEAQACGTPVIAYGKGGATETVINGETGIFFDKQDEACIISAVRSFEKDSSRFDPETIRENAKRFSPEEFTRQLSDLVDLRYREFTQNGFLRRR